MAGKLQALKPQPGFQTDFLSSSADIVIGGGAAGAGKSFALLMEPLRHINNKKFSGVIFRRTFPQINNQGGLWDTSWFYSGLQAVPNKSDHKWIFPSGSSIGFQHLQHEADVLSHQGAQYPFIGFDELTHFTEHQFFYLLSRNRSLSGVKPYVRATCNPDPDSWVSRFIAWWIDPETGYPIKERAGKLRYFIKKSNEFIWGDSKEEVIKASPEIKDIADQVGVRPDDLIKSVTFIPGNIYHNPELLKSNPEYLANLMAQDDQIKSQLLDGNWKIRMDETSLFHPTRLDDLFSNEPADTLRKYITCDVARFGRDFMVIAVWEGWKVVKLIIEYKSEAHEIVSLINEQCKAFNIPRSYVLVDQDGVGGGVVALGKYNGFSGGAAAMKDPQTKIKEAYDMLKTQCYYRYADKVNDGEVGIVVNPEMVIVAGNRSTKVKYKGQMMDVRDIIKIQHRAIRKAKLNNDKKLCINSKEEQKAILGASPDFADVMMMRYWFELVKTGTSRAMSYGDGVK